jgi:hypothetical protein
MAVPNSQSQNQFVGSARQVPAGASPDRVHINGTRNVDVKKAQNSNKSQPNIVQSTKTSLSNPLLY